MIQILLSAHRIPADFRLNRYFSGFLMPRGQEWAACNFPRGQEWAACNFPRGQQWADRNLPRGQQWAARNFPRGQEWAARNLSRGQQWAVRFTVHTNRTAQPESPSDFVLFSGCTQKKYSFPIFFKFPLYNLKKIVYNNKCIF